LASKRIQKKEKKSLGRMNKAGARSKTATAGVLRGMLDGSSKGTSAEWAEKMVDAVGDRKTLKQIFQNNGTSHKATPEYLMAAFALMSPTQPTPKQKTLPKLLETLETDVMPTMNKKLDTCTFGYWVGTLAEFGTGSKVKGTIMSLKKRAKELSQLDATAVAALTESDLVKIRKDLSQHAASYQMDVLSAYSSYSNIVSKIQIKADNAYKLGLAKAKKGNKNRAGKLLVAHFKDIYSKRQLCPAETRPNFTYLHVAASLTLLDVVRSLLKHGAPVDAREEAHGNTPLNVVCNSDAHPDQPRIIQAFLEAGADINAEGWNKRHSNGRVSVGRTSLCTAVALLNLECVQTLLENGADVNIRTGDGATSLQLAIDMDAGLPIITALINAGVDVNVVQCANSVIKHIQGGPHMWEGCSAVTIAEFKGHFPVLKLLMDSGGRSNVGSEPAFYRAQMLMKAARVRLIGLRSSSLNGLVGVIQGPLNPTTFRFLVVLEENECGKEKVKVKIENLEVVQVRTRMSL